MYLLYIFPRAPHTYGFIVLTSLTHPRKIILVVLQIGKYEKPKTYQHPYVFDSLEEITIQCSLPPTHLITATEVLPFEVILHLSTEAQTAWHNVWARHSQTVYKEVGKRISGSTGHSPSSVPEEQGNSEGEHFSRDNDAELELLCISGRNFCHFGDYMQKQEGLYIINCSVGHIA
jgi:hypothetical protein